VKTATEEEEPTQINCPYCGLVLPLYGYGNIWIHLLELHPDTPQGRIIGAVLQAIPFVPVSDN
jgi:hypothetical protein